MLKKIGGAADHINTIVAKKGSFTNQRPEFTKFTFLDILKFEF